MPLVLMCGFPSSGKTTRTNEIKDYFEKTCQKDVKVISDDNVGAQKNDVYEDSKKEKIIRGNLKSAVQRDLNKEQVIILDSLNYIKGFRYELYCVSKECQTTHCVVFCNTNKDDVMSWNTERVAEEQYNTDILTALIMRFEEPRSNNRWDSPLFLIQKEDVLPLETMADALLRRKAPPQNASTLPQPLSSTNFLYELDRVTKDIVSSIIEGQKMAVPGDQIKVPGAVDKVFLSRSFTVAELQRSRRQFITYTKMHPVDNPEKISNMFVQYINNTLQ